MRFHTPSRSRQSQPVLLGTALATALISAGGAVAHAQMHHVDAPERVTRAIGVYEWTGDLSKPTAARFVPVSLFIDGHFEDAGLYMARPIPFALQPGDVYALEHAGEPEGLLDLDFARRVVTGKAIADDNPEGAWFGYGKFTPETAPKPSNLHASSHMSKLESSAGPNTPAGAKLPADDSDGSGPHLDRRNSGSGSSGSSSGSGTPSSPGTQTGSTTGTGSGKTSPDSADDETDRPTLRRRDPSQDATRHKAYGSKKDTASVTATGPALGDDPDRPILGHSTGEAAGTPELTGLPPNLHQAVAVSDASHRDAHPFARDWESPAERADTLTALAALARTRLAEYMNVNHLIASGAPLPAAEMEVAGTGQATSPAPTAPVIPVGSPEPAAAPRLQRGVPQQYKNEGPGTAAPSSDSSANPGASRTPKAGSSATTASATTPSVRHAATSTHAAHRTTKTPSSHPVPLTLGQQEISGFTLSYGGLPTFVYTATASVAPASGTAAPATGSTKLAAYVTVVAQRLPTGELQVALSAATDSAHLDRGPRLRLVDAVDPDDSHRASLLFELRGGSSRQFALYRLTSVHAEQTFTTATLE